MSAMVSELREECFQLRVELEALTYLILDSFHHYFSCIFLGLSPTPFPVGRSPALL